MKIADLINQKKLLLAESKQLPDEGHNIRSIREDLESCPRAWTAQILNDPTNDQPFLDEIAAVHQEQIRANPELVDPLDGQRIAEEARQLRLAAIQITLHDIAEGDVELPSNAQPEKVRKQSPLAPLLR